MTGTRGTTRWNRGPVVAGLLVLGLVAYGLYNAVRPPTATVPPAPAAATAGLDDALGLAAERSIRSLSGASWYPYIERSGGELDVAARDEVVFVGGIPPSLAELACLDVAYVVRTIAIGVVIVYAGTAVEDCQTP